MRLARQGWAHAERAKKALACTEQCTPHGVQRDGGPAPGLRGAVWERSRSARVRRKAPSVFWKAVPFAGRRRNGGLGRRAGGGSTPSLRGSMPTTNQGVRERFEEGRPRKAGPSLRGLSARGGRKAFVTRCCAGGRPKKRPSVGPFSGRRTATRQTQRERSKPLPGTGEDRSAVSRARGSCRVAEVGKRRLVQ